jgi:NOL1/NOP2/fmu family ribosome biogenesis protein
MSWTALGTWLDSRDVFGASARLGLVLVVAGSIALACSAVARAVELNRGRARK